VIARLTRYAGSEEAVEGAVRKLVTLQADRPDRTIFLRGRGGSRDTLIVLWFGEENEALDASSRPGLAEVDAETFDLVSPGEERASLRVACEVLLQTLATRRLPETEHIYGELEALSAMLGGAATA
jgi:hypothetical protein